MITHYARPEGLPPASGYGHVTAATGTVVHISGQVPARADGSLVAEDVSAQTEQVFENLTTALRAAGAPRADVVKLTYFLTDLAEVRAVRDRYLDPEASREAAQRSPTYPSLLREHTLRGPQDVH